MLRLHQIKLRPGEPVSAIPAAIARMLKIDPAEIGECCIVRESIDARDKSDIRFIYSADFTVPDEERLLKRVARRKQLQLAKTPARRYAAPASGYEGGLAYRGERPVIVGFGPCGMFAGLILAEAGLQPVILERGKPVDERAADVEAFWNTGRLHPESNVQFGEGGAGTFSDGKLTTGTKDYRIAKVIDELVEAGADPSIRYKQLPHVGTDVLRVVVRAIREKILALGGEFHFQTRLDGLVLEDGALQGLQVTDLREDSDRAGAVGASHAGRAADAAERAGCVESARAGSKENTLRCRQVILAPGNGARDTFVMLEKAGVAMEAKPFSVGVRIEHPQYLIDYAQYGEVNDSEGRLAAAVYKLSHHCANGRGVYTFCMCPGGYVVASSSEPEGVVTNGMSYYARDGVNANSALLVGVSPEDCYRETGREGDPLAGMYFQRALEQKAYAVGGGGYVAPAQTVGGFLASVSGDSDQTEAPVQTTYRPGVSWQDMRECLPAFVTEAMAEALPALARKLPGFDLPAAVMTGVETRSSSPVRLLRDPKTLESLTVSGLYPGGEGAGYAGGIVSSAVDGIKLAERIIQSLAAE